MSDGLKASDNALFDVKYFTQVQSLFLRLLAKVQFWYFMMNWSTESQNMSDIPFRVRLG